MIDFAFPLINLIHTIILCCNPGTSVAISESLFIKIVSSMHAITYHHCFNESRQVIEEQPSPPDKLLKEKRFRSFEVVIGRNL